LPLCLSVSTPCACLERFPLVLLVVFFPYAKTLFFSLVRTVCPFFHPTACCSLAHSIPFDIYPFFESRLGLFFGAAICVNSPAAPGLWFAFFVEVICFCSHVRPRFTLTGFYLPPFLKSGKPDSSAVQRKSRCCFSHGPLFLPTRCQLFPGLSPMRCPFSQNAGIFPPPPFYFFSIDDGTFLRAMII